MYDTIPVKTKRNDDVVITMDGYDKSNYKWDPQLKKTVYIKKGLKQNKNNKFTDIHKYYREDAEMPEVEKKAWKNLEEIINGKSPEYNTPEKRIEELKKSYTIAHGRI